MISILCKRLKKLRKERSQYRIAKDLGTDQQVLSRYERGERTPDAEMLLRIADYYRVSVDYLLGKTEISEIPTDGKIQAAAEITGLTESALNALSEIKDNNRKTSYSDIISTLLEYEYLDSLLSLIAAKISYSAMRKRISDSNDENAAKEHIKSSFYDLELDGIPIHTTKETLFTSILQTKLMSTLESIAAEYILNFPDTPAERLETYNDYVNAIAEKVKHGEISKNEYMSIINDYLKGSAENGKRNTTEK